MQSVSENPLFQKFMGVKYRVGENAEKDTDGKISVSRQENAAPVIYATDQVIAEDAYRNMAFPYNQTILMRYAAAKGGTEPDTREITASMPDIWETEVRILEHLGIHKTDSGYQIETKQKVKTSLAVAGSEADRERILFLQFDVKNRRKSQDVIIELAGIRNNLSAKSHVYYNGNRTFTYVMKLKKGQKKRSFCLGKERIRSQISEVFGRCGCIKRGLLIPVCVLSGLEDDGRQPDLRRYGRRAHGISCDVDSV